MTDKKQRYYAGDKSLQGKEQFERMRDFNDYLESTSKTLFQLFFSDGSVIQIPYKHRWSKAYQKSVLAKLYQLEAWAKRHGLGFGMLSLTTSQAGLTDKQILENLKEAWDKYRQTLSKLGIQNFNLHEPHKSGIVHIHTLIMGKIDDAVIERLRNLWVEKYEMGNDHAFEFSADRMDVKSLVNYLMKYMSKTVCTDVNEDDALMRFHSLFWETERRLWSSSKYLGYVMRILRKRNNPQTILDSIVMTGENEGVIYDRLEYPQKPDVFDILAKCLKKDILYEKIPDIEFQFYAELRKLADSYMSFTMTEGQRYRLESFEKMTECETW